VIWIGVLIYVVIGIGILVWIKNDNEFRHSDTAELLAWVSIIMWPAAAIIWLAMRPEEQIHDLGLKKSHQDFKNFMRQRRADDADFMKHIRSTTPDNPMKIGDASDYHDYPLEELIEKGEWQEALRTSNDMLRFAKEQQEMERVVAYERYIKDIKQKRQDDLD